MQSMYLVVQQAAQVAGEKIAEHGPDYVIGGAMGVALVVANSLTQFFKKNQVHAGNQAVVKAIRGSTKRVCREIRGLKAEIAQIQQTNTTAREAQTEKLMDHVSLKVQAIPQALSNHITSVMQRSKTS